MKAFLLYWFCGCLVAGLSFGSYIKRCPNDDIPMSEVMMVAATWPAFFFATFTAPHPVTLSPCKVAHQLTGAVGSSGVTND